MWYVLLGLMIAVVIGTLATLVWLVEKMREVLDDERELDVRLANVEVQLRAQRREWTDGLDQLEGRADALGDDLAALADHQGQLVGHLQHLGERMTAAEEAHAHQAERTERVLTATVQQSKRLKEVIGE